jgi:hypothetical protein
LVDALDPVGVLVTSLFRSRSLTQPFQTLWFFGVQVPALLLQLLF